MQRVMRRWREAIALAVCLALVFLCAGAHAQDANGAVKGTITDGHGKALAGASVTLGSLSSDHEMRSLTDNQGYYAFVNLPAGRYSLQISANGFKVDERIVNVSAGEQMLDIKLALASVSEEVVVEGEDNGSLATQEAVVKSPLDAASARSEISSLYIREYTSPMTDFSDITQAAPGTMSFSTNGIGNGQAKTWFRGFKDGMYTMTWDGVPFQDSNDPTHHSWAYVPAPAISYIDFDRSPGTASDVGPANFGGSIHMFSPKLSNVPEAMGAVSYGSYNSVQVLGQYNSGLFAGDKANLWFEGHHQSSDGYQTNNFQQRTAATAKFIYRPTQQTTFTLVGTSVIVDANTPNNDATRRQIFHHGKNYLMESNQYMADGVTLNPQYYKYYTYHVPTNFEVATLDSDLGRGWAVNSKTYTYSYSNHQHYQNKQDSDQITTALPADVPDGQNLSAITESLSSNSGINKLNQYNRIGEIAAFSKSSSLGVLRFGSWVESTATHRYQVGSDPRTWVDSTKLSDLKFHERFWTGTYQPYIEYQLVALRKWTITAGIKDANYRMYLQQYADGKTVGSLNGNAFVTHRADYNSWLPSVEANYRIRSNWSAYGQYGRGSQIPPSSVFDSTGAQVATLPKPTVADTFQGGTVVHLNRISMDADLYHVHFDNNYVSYSDSSNFTYFYAAPPSNTLGFEGEGNLALISHLSLSANGTVGRAKYEAQSAYTTPSGSVFAATPEYWVSNAAHDTESLGLLYQSRSIHAGLFSKRIGTRYDAAGSYSATVSGVKTSYGSGQNIVYDPFWMNNLFLNYTVHRKSFFDGSKIKLSVNNLLNSHDLLSVSSAANSAAPLVPYVKSAADQLQLQSGRSIMISFQLGIRPHNRN